jgi:hypothetical protein
MRSCVYCRRVAVRDLCRARVIVGGGGRCHCLAHFCYTAVTLIVSATVRVAVVPSRRFRAGEQVDIAVCVYVRVCAAVWVCGCVCVSGRALCLSNCMWCVDSI